MARRSTPQREIDERAFPVRLFIMVPVGGYGRLRGAGLDTIDSWLAREIGRGDYAYHSGSKLAVAPAGREVTAHYFRHPADAVRFLEAFPALEIADGTAGRGYTSPALPFGRT